jgi:outer membrane protein OmpA-like peptidoglycan-associated protein
MKNNLLLWLLLSVPTLDGLAQMYYVSPQGRDTNPGTLQRPFATLQKAVAAVGKNGSSAQIILRGGTYELDKPVVIERSNLTLKAYKDETPVISGGKVLKTNWQPAGPGRWKTAVPTYFRQLFINGQRATRARFPNAGQWADQWFQPDTIQLAQKRLVLNHPIPAHFAQIKNAEMHATAWWHWLRQRVARFDPEHRAIFTVTEPSPEVSGRKIDHVDRIHFENDLAFLDAEGEWFLDSLTRTLYYQSMQKPTATFVYPIAERLIDIRGTATQPLSGLKIEGLTFANTEWAMPAIERKTIQAGVWGSLNGKPVFAPPAALMLFWASDCRIANCRFENLGEGAIILGDGCRRNRIEANQFHDIGSNVIQIGWRTNYVGKGKRNTDANVKDGSDHPLYFTYETPEAVPSHNVVHNNHLNTFCTTDLGGVGIWVGYSPYNELTHNLLENFSYSGISVGWRWDTLQQEAHHNLIAWNEVRNGMQYLSDGGGIYTAGRQEGTKILNNWVHGIGGGPVLGEGIYNDAGGGYQEIAYNYIERIKSLPFKFHRNIFNSINLHDNNGIAGKQEVIFPERATVGSIRTTDNAPPTTELYGLVRKERIVLNAIQFNKGESTLLEAGKISLNTLAQWLQSQPDTRIELSGHTSNEGNPTDNKSLSGKRAEVCKDYLVNTGIETARIRSVGYGSEQPLESNSTEEGRAKNRRVELKIVE